MEVKDFVKTSLVQIVQGVSEAIKETQNNSRAVINPALPHSSHSNPNEVSFDIAVTVQENASVHGGGGIKVLIANLGVGTETALSNTAYSRLSFSIPVAWPSVAKDQYPDKEGRVINDYDPFRADRTSS